MQKHSHTFLFWVVPATVSSCAVTVGLLIGAAQVWPSIKTYDEDLWRAGAGVVTAPLFWIVAAAAISLWSWLVVRTWPGRENAVLPHPNMTPYEFSHYLRDESEWGWKTSRYKVSGVIRGQQGTWKLPTATMVPSEFQRLAQVEGANIRVFGVLKGASAPELIPTVFWVTNSLSMLSTVLPGKGETEPTIPVWQERVIYDHLAIESAGVMKAWPRRNLLKRIVTDLEYRREQRLLERLPL